jgi:hypothetical protein
MTVVTFGHATLDIRCLARASEAGTCPRLTGPSFARRSSNGTKNVKVVQEVLYIGLKIEKLSYGATCDISYYESASNNALASWRSAVSNPSVNQP